jgi:hypothetical protein
MYELDARPGINGGWVGLVKTRVNGELITLYTTEPKFGSYPLNAMAIAEREYKAMLKFEAELQEVDSVRRERY